MRVQLLGSVTAIAAAASIAASANSPSVEESTATVDSTGAPPTQAQAITPEEASRFAKQASFGPTQELIDDIVAKRNRRSWVQAQFELSASNYTDLVAKTVPGNYCAKFSGAEVAICNRDNFSAVPVQMRFYANAIGKDDQLRQRIAFSLSQILVTSAQDVPNTAGLAAYQQLLLLHAFGNYRDILMEITKSPYMGYYLSMADSSKDHPNENYARELLQLFSVGTNLLNPDGTPQLDATGSTIPSYSNSDVREIARALTGWTWARNNGAPLTDSSNRDWTRPMVPYLNRFDAGAKNFLGVTINTNSTQDANVNAVVNAVFNHPNTGPYIARRLIQQLTTPNPSRDYVKRVAERFADNGEGVRGDMKAVILAIFLDPEAIGATTPAGKVKEPILLATSLARAIGFTTDGYAFVTRDGGMGQPAFKSPSVFNYYPATFPLSQGGGVNSPASKLMNTSTAIARHNLIYDWTVAGEGGRGDFKPELSPIGTVPHWATWEANGTDNEKTLDRINLVLLNGTMTPTQRQGLRVMMSSIKYNDQTTQARKRAQNALYVVASSPLFQVDR